MVDRELCCLEVRGGVEVFDEDYFIADFTVDQLVYSAGCDEKTVSAGAHSFLLALQDVVGGIVGGICDGRVAERFAAEAGSGIAQVKHHGSSGANAGEFNDLFGIKSGSVLHCVHQDLAQCQHQVELDVLR